MGAAITTATVGQTVELVVDVDQGIDGEPAGFTILDPDGATVAMLTGDVHRAQARAGWKVDVGDRATPVTLTFTATVRGAEVAGPPLEITDAVVVHGLAWIEGATGPTGAVAVHADDPAAAAPTTLAAPAVAPTTPLRLRVEVGGSSGAPARTPFKLAVERRTAAGALVETIPVDVAPAPEARFVTVDWVAQLTDGAQTGHETSRFSAVIAGASAAAPPPASTMALRQQGPGSGGPGSGGPASIPATVTAPMTIRLTEQPTAVLAAVKQSSHPAGPWRDAEGIVVSVDAAQTMVIRDNVPVTVGAAPDPGEVVFTPPAGDLGIEVHTAGPHKHPVWWVVEPDNASTPVRPASKNPDDRAIHARHRISLWADPKNVVAKNFASAGRTYQRGTIDDISLLTTVQCEAAVGADPLALTINWDAIHQGLDPSADYLAAIRACHAQGLQVLAGFALVSSNPPADPSKESAADLKLRQTKNARIARFADWLDDVGKLITASGAAKATDPAKQGHPKLMEAWAAGAAVARSIVGFLDAAFAGADRVDGISFDIEDFGPKAATWCPGNARAAAAVIDPIREALRIFYHSVARALNRDESSRLCTIACGGMTDDDNGTTGVLALAAGRLHLYDLPIGAPNIVLRPMGYDNAGGEDSATHKSPYNNDGTDGKGGQFAWHKAVVEHAILVKQVPPAQFQLGIKDFVPPNSGGQGGVVSSQAHQLNRARDILLPHRVGVAFFAMRSPPDGKVGAAGSLGQDWAHQAKLNATLNPGPGGKPVMGNQLGQPIHVPLGGQSWVRVRP